MSSTRYDGLIGKDDLNFATGATGAAETFERRTSTGGVLTQEKIDASHLKFRKGNSAAPKSVEDLVDGTMAVYRSYSDFTTLITEIGANNAVVEVWDSQTISSSLSIPANVHVKFIWPGKFIIANACTPILRSFSAPSDKQIFDCQGTGAVDLTQSNLFLYFAEWWGIDGTADDVQINAAITALPLKGTLKLHPKIYTLAAQVARNRNVRIIGSDLVYPTGGGTAPGAVTVPSTTGTTGTILNCRAISGVAWQEGGATTQEYYMEGIWFDCGPMSSASTVTKGIDIPTGVSRATYKNVRVTGVTPGAQDGSGTGKGFAVNGFDCIFDGVELEYNDIGVYLDDLSQGAKFYNSKIFWNYSWGVKLVDTNTVKFVSPQIEKNGVVADTSGSINIQGSIAIDFDNLYNEQSLAIWPGCIALIENSAGTAYPEAITISGRSAGGSATKGVIFNRGWDIDISNFHISGFTTTDVSMEPDAVSNALVNIKRRQRYDLNNNYYRLGYIDCPELNLLRNWDFNNWWTTTSSTTTSPLIGWDKTTSGTLSQSTDAGKFSSFCAKLVGEGDVNTVVQFSQTVATVGSTYGNLIDAVQVLARVKAPTTNADTITTRMLIGTEVIIIEQNDDWQWVRLGAQITASPITVTFQLCKSNETAQATDELYVAAAIAVPGYQMPPGLVGEIDRSLYGQVAWEPETAATGTLNAADEDTVTIAITGVALGDNVQVFAPYSLQGCFMTGYASNTDEVTILVGNPTAGGINFASDTWKVRVNKP